MEILRAPWIVQSITDTLRNSRTKYRNSQTGASVTLKGELALPVAKKKFVQVIKFLQWNHPVTAEISDKQRYITAVFSESCKQEYESRKGQPLTKIRGGLIQITSFSYVFEGSDGPLFWKGITFREQVKEKHTTASSSSDLSNADAKALPIPNPYLLITSFEHIGSDGSRTFGTPEPVVDDEGIQELLKRLPRADHAAKLHRRASKNPTERAQALRTKPTDSTLKRPSVSTQTKASSSRSDDDSEDRDKPESRETSLPNINVAQPPKASRRASTTSFDDPITVAQPLTSALRADYADLDFDVQSSKQLLPEHIPVTSFEKTARQQQSFPKPGDYDDLEFSSLAVGRANKGHPVHRDPIGPKHQKDTVAAEIIRDIGSHSSNRNLPAINPKNAGSRSGTESDSSGGWLHPGWEGMREVTREDARIPRAQRKLLRLPEAWYSPPRRAFPSGYDKIAKVQLVPKTYEPRKIVPSVVIPKATVDRSQYTQTQHDLSDSEEELPWSPTPDTTPKRRDINAMPPSSSAPRSSNARKLASQRTSSIEESLQTSVSQKSGTKRASQSSTGTTQRKKIAKRPRKARKVAPKRARKKAEISEEEEDSYSSPPTRELSVEPPYPVINPFGRTRVDKYGLLGAQSVQLWNEKRKARKAREASGEVLEESDIDHFADIEDDDEQPEHEIKESHGHAAKNSTNGDADKEIPDQSVGSREVHDKSQPATEDEKVTSPSRSACLLNGIQEPSLAVSIDKVSDATNGSQTLETIRNDIPQRQSGNKAVSPSPEPAQRAFTADRREEQEEMDEDDIPVEPLVARLVTNPIELKSDLQTKRNTERRQTLQPVPASTAPLPRPVVQVKETPYRRATSFVSGMLGYGNRSFQSDSHYNDGNDQDCIPATADDEKIVESSLDLDKNTDRPMSTSNVPSQQETPDRTGPEGMANENLPHKDEVGGDNGSFILSEGSPPSNLTQSRVGSEDFLEDKDEAEIERLMDEELQAAVKDNDRSISSERAISSSPHLLVHGEVASQKHAASSTISPRRVSIALESLNKAEFRLDRKRKRTKPRKMKKADFASQEIRDVHAQDIPALLEEQRKNFFRSENTTVEVSSASDRDLVSKSLVSVRKRPRTASPSVLPDHTGRNDSPSTTPQRSGSTEDPELPHSKRPRTSRSPVNSLASRGAYISIESDSDDSKDIIPAFSPVLPPKETAPLWKPRLAAVQQSIPAPESTTPTEGKPEVYAGFRERTLAVPGYEKLSDEQKKALDERRRNYFGTSRPSLFAPSPTGMAAPTQHSSLGKRPRQGDEDEEEWWKENTPLKGFVTKYKKLKLVRAELDGR